MEYRTCDEHFNHGVFSTYDNAKQFLKDKNWVSYEEFEIEEFEIDKRLD